MKLQNGAGSIVCLDKTGKKRRKPYGVRITTGWKNGKQVRKYIGYYATQQEAIIALAEYHTGGVNLDYNNITVNELFDEWMKRVEKKQLSESVTRIHKMTNSRFGSIGKKKVKDVRSAHWQTWLDNIDLKPSSKGKIRSTVQQMLDFAVNNDIINKNYAKHLDIEGKTEATGSIFTKEELDVLWENADDKYVRQLLIMVYTGMRIGEMLAIHKSQVFIEDGYITGGLKTKAGKNRTIPLHNKIIPLVKEQLGDNNWLVQSNRGSAMTYQNASTYYEKTFAKFGMKHKPHDCRKTAVSIMHSTGIPMEVIRIIVGHSGKGVTEQVYLRKTPKELVEYINTISI